jgi:alpha/beta superfamily hydrolase
VDDCRQDLAAWVQWLTQNAGPRVGLLAHSLGAVKAIYALSRAPQPAVGCLVALSPPRLSYSAFCQSPQGPAFLETYKSAERLIQDGRPAALLEVQLPLSYVVTAAGFVEKYGPDERFNFLQFVSSVPCPTLITFGSLETESNMAFQGVPEALALLAARHRNLQVEIIAAGDHFYSGVRQELVRLVEGWLRTSSAHPPCSGQTEPTSSRLL